MSRIMIFGGHGRVALLLEPLLVARGDDVSAGRESDIQRGFADRVIANKNLRALRSAVHMDAALLKLVAEFSGPLFSHLHHGRMYGPWRRANDHPVFAGSQIL